MSQTFNDAVPAITRDALSDLTAIRNNFAALKSCFSGATAPPDPVAGMWWYDTTANMLKLRNEANNAWLDVYDFANGRAPLALLATNCSKTVVAGSGVTVTGSLTTGSSNVTVGISSGGVGNTHIANAAIGAEKFQTGTDERTWVMARTAGASAGEVGTYAMLATIGTHSAGDTALGSALRYAGLTGESGQQPVLAIDAATAVSGTWRCMGTCISTAGKYAVSLWLRIS